MTDSRLTSRSGRSSAMGLALAVCALAASGQTIDKTSGQEAALQAGSVASLALSPGDTATLERAVKSKDYLTSEKLLLAEIARDPHSARAGRLLAYIGTVFFLNADYFNAAVAWKKSQAIAPLDEKLRFSLAMAYVRLEHKDWARKELDALAAGNSTNALYPYWIGRLDYDGHRYSAAIADFQRAIALDAKMARAYDNLGLCYYYQNQNEQAIAAFTRAIELDREAAKPSAWPYFNLAIALQFLNRPAEAETNFREALQLDPSMEKAHFQLGTLLEDQGKLDAALSEMKEAARLNPSYAEPHMAMARLDRRLGHETEAQDEVKTYLRLHPHGTPQ